MQELLRAQAVELEGDAVSVTQRRGVSLVRCVWIFGLLCNIRAALLAMCTSR